MSPAVDVEGAAHFRELFRQNSPLLPHWIAFYTRLVAQIVPERLAENGQVVWRCLNTSALHPQQAVRLLEQLPEFAAFTVPTTPAVWRICPLKGLQHLVLLSADELRRLSLLFALVAHRDSVCSTIRREDVRSIEAEAGEAGRQFALRRAATVLSDPDVRRQLAQSFVPEPVSVGTRIALTAARVLSFMLQEMPQEFRTLVLLTFPLSWTAHPEWNAWNGRAERTECSELSPALADATRHILRTLLLKEVNPAWNAFM